MKAKTPDVHLAVFLSVIVLGGAPTHQTAVETRQLAMSNEKARTACNEHTDYSRRLACLDDVGRRMVKDYNRIAAIHNRHAKAKHHVAMLQTPQPAATPLPATQAASNRRKEHATCLEITNYAKRFACINEVARRYKRVVIAVPHGSEQVAKAPPAEQETSSLRRDCKKMTSRAQRIACARNAQTSGPDGTQKAVVEGGDGTGLWSTLAKVTDVAVAATAVGLGAYAASEGNAAALSSVQEATNSYFDAKRQHREMERRREKRKRERIQRERYQEQAERRRREMEANRKRVLQEAEAERELRKQEFVKAQVLEAERDWVAQANRRRQGRKNES